jgi:drug/metabolite transporter (DMT)-like permease
VTTSAGAPAAGLSLGALAQVAVLALVWGCNWPVLKMGVSLLPPLTFRGLTLPFAALGLLAVAKLSGESIRLPRRLWGEVALLALLNIGGWNALVLFGVAQLPAGRSVIIAYTMPIWTVLFSLVLLREPFGRRKAVGLVLGMAGLALLVGDDLRQLQRAPTAMLYILGASTCWALGTVLLRKWKPPVPPNALSGWMMLLGWVPIALLAPLVSPGPLPELSGRAWFAILYNVFLAGTLAHWAWFTLVRTLPVAVSSMASLPVPVVGVFAGMLVLGERPRAGEWLALALVLGAMVAVLWPGRAAKPTGDPALRG